MLRAAVALSIFAACSSPSPEQFDASPLRYVVDSVTVPTVAGQAATFGYDFDGDGQPDNAFGNITTALASQGDITNDVADLVSDGAFTSTIEIVQGDDGDAAQLTWDSLATWTESYTNTGVLTTDGPRAIAVMPRLPALIDADPTPIALDEIVMELIPDDADGLDVQVQALADGSAFRAAAAASVVQMITSNPRSHLLLGAEIGIDHGGVVNVADVEQWPFFAALAASDQANDQISIGYRFHLAYCAAGWCNDAPIVDHCNDRIVDADETGIDCGGSCHPCSGGITCAVDADCDSRACNAGTCQAPTCDDGVLDGLELGVDCGNGCGGCSSGAPCLTSSDCASGDCDGNGGYPYSFGTCR